MAEKPDAYLSELAKLFNCTDSAVFYALRRWKITRKKTVTYAEQSKEECDRFKKRLSRVPENKRVYLDESGIDDFLYRKCGNACIAE